MIQVITFDFWDTIVTDNSDEAIRKERGLPTKKQAREDLFIKEIAQHHPNFSQKRIVEAFDYANQQAVHSWKVEHYTCTVAERLQKGLDHLQIAKTPGFDKLIHDFEIMEVEIQPIILPKAVETIQALSKQYRLGIISDTIITPGTGLRQILKDNDLLHCFETFVFSDEAGAAKPAPKVFELAQAGFNVPYENMVHVGDREGNDILGPIKMGMKAILYTGAVDRDSKNTKANAICTHYDQLQEIVATL